MDVQTCDLVARLQISKRRIEICKRVVAKLLKLQLALAWGTFVECVVERKHNRETSRKVLSRMTHRTLAGAFACYAENVEAVLAQRERKPGSLLQLATILNTTRVS